MKSRPLTLVGAFLLLIAIFLVINKEKPETTNRQPQPSVSLKVQQRMLKPSQEKQKAKISGVHIITTKAAMNTSQPAR